MNNIKKIVLNIPHSSMNNHLEGWDLEDSDIDLFTNLVLDKTDLLTNVLFYSEVNKVENVVAIIGEVNRFFCDLERLENDPLDDIGQGIVYTKYTIFNKTISENEKQEIINKYYYPHIEKLKKELTPDSLLIDCHSFIDEDNTKIDINLGYNEDWSKPKKDVFDFIFKYFSDIGYKIGINTPYSNSFSPKTDFNYPSIMIEVNKRLYLSEDFRVMNSRAYKLNYHLLSLYKKLLS